MCLIILEKQILNFYLLIKLNGCRDCCWECDIHCQYNYKAILMPEIGETNCCKQELSYHEYTNAISV